MSVGRLAVKFLANSFNYRSYISGDTLVDDVILLSRFIAITKQVLAVRLVRWGFRGGLPPTNAPPRQKARSALLNLIIGI